MFKEIAGNIMTICNYIECTGCAACRDICPKQCITMQPDELDALYPYVDEHKCINCGLCVKTCPNNRNIEYRKPQKVWVAWSNDASVRKNSASGGIAYELYRYWLCQGGVAVGVVYERDKGCHFVIIEKEDDLKQVQNSKYTFSDTDGVYKVLKEKLQAETPVLFIGMPCQVAGFYGFLKKDYSNLVTVDIICHGMSPTSYLQQHIESIEMKKKQHTSKLFFRDPKYHTYTYTFTLYNLADKEFYNRRVLTTDNYQLGYHRALIYRENCYHCRYAQRERIADLTIGDFSGLGKYADFSKSKHNVSCVFQNTDRGADLLGKLETKIYKEERPEAEAFEVEQQLKAPSIKHPRRIVFENVYREERNDEKAADAALSREKYNALKLRIVIEMKAIIRLLLPKRFMQIARSVLCRN